MLNDAKRGRSIKKTEVSLSLYKLNKVFVLRVSTIVDGSNFMIKSRNLKIFNYVIVIVKMRFVINNK